MIVEGFVIVGLFGIGGVGFEVFLSLVLFFIFFVIEIVLWIEIVEFIYDVDGEVDCFGVKGDGEKDFIWNLIGWMFFLFCVLNDIGLNVDFYIMGFFLVVLVLGFI